MSVIFCSLTSISLSEKHYMRGLCLEACESCLLPLSESVRAFVFPLSCVVLKCRPSVSLLPHFLLGTTCKCHKCSVHLKSGIDGSIESCQDQNRFISHQSFFIHHSMWMTAGLQLPQFSFSNCLASVLFDLDYISLFSYENTVQDSF